jgi:hypothetical protein
MSFTFVVLAGFNLVAQTTMPEVLDKGSLNDQLKYLEEKTRIYENYRAIREDMFQKISKNATDSLLSAKTRIAEFAGLTGILNNRIDSLNSSLSGTKADLEEVTRTKNSIKIIGIEINKAAYNTIMWIIAGALLFLLATGFLAFKRNLTVTRNTKKELDELKTEYEAYRQKTRLEREKMSMDHFNELKRLKGIK